MIGAGLGRTGTLSLKAALEQLGFAPCHHMTVTFSQPEESKLWDQVEKLINVDENLKTIFSGFKATVDFPGCLFYDRFLEWNPDGKVILTVRDSPEKWAQSARDTIFKHKPPSSNLFGRLLRRFLRLIISFTATHHFIPIGALIGRELGANVTDVGAEELARVYTRWNRRVRETVPQGKLLEFNVKEGWEPLCKFLGVTVPDSPFPRCNDKGEFEEMSKKYGISNPFVPLIKVIGSVFLAILFSWIVRGYFM